MKSKMKTLKLAAFLGAITVATAGFGFANVTAFADENDVAKIEGGDSYETLTEAYDAAVDGDTITLLKNATGAGLKIKKEVTVDFGGFTYTVNSPVGSPGTETLGFQVRKEANNVTFKNGTIKVVEQAVGGKEIKAVVFAYCDFTLEDMIIDGTGNTDMVYGVAFMNGDSSVVGGTSIIVPDSAVAVDIDGAQNSYGEVSVAFDTTGEIVGDVNIYGAEATTEIVAGTFNGEISNADGESELTISGGTFNDPYIVNYLTDDATVEINGFTYGNIARVGSATYETLQEAIDNANGAEIKLLGDVIGAGVTIDKKTNIDFNGYTYVVDSGVEVDGVSYGFYIKPANAVSGDKVELKNGEIVIDNTDVDIAVFSECPNEAQLNIKNFDIQANNATALMVSGSEANIEGESKISSNETAILVNNSNEVNRVQLVVIALENNNPQVNGRILVEGNNIVAQLVNGEFNGSIYSNNADNLRISGGKYSTDVTQYVVAGKTLEQEGMYFLVVEDNNGGNGNDDNQGGNNQNPSQPGGGEPERPDGLTDEQWMAILGVLGALNNSQNNGAQTNDSEVAAPANNTAAVVIAIVASSLVVLIVAAAVVLWILEKKEIFKISKYFKD